jgi:hypothetical protein
MVKSIRVEVRFLKKENEESKHGSECAFRRCALKLTGLCAGDPSALALAMCSWRGCLCRIRRAGLVGEGGSQAFGRALHPTIQGSPGLHAMAS